jgi:hypothetical protein
VLADRELLGGGPGGGGGNGIPGAQAPLPEGESSAGLGLALEDVGVGIAPAEAALLEPGGRTNGFAFESWGKFVAILLGLLFLTLFNFKHMLKTYCRDGPATLEPDACDRESASVVFCLKASMAEGSGFLFLEKILKSLSGPLVREVERSRPGGGGNEGAEGGIGD